MNQTSFVYRCALLLGLLVCYMTFIGCPTAEEVTKDVLQPADTGMGEPPVTEPPPLPEDEDGPFDMMEEWPGEGDDPQVAPHEGESEDMPPPEDEPGDLPGA